MEQVVNDTEWIAIGRVTVDGGGMILWVGDLDKQAEVVEYQQLRRFGSTLWSIQTIKMPCQKGPHRVVFSQK